MADPFETLHEHDRPTWALAPAAEIRRRGDRRRRRHRAGAAVAGAGLTLATVLPVALLSGGGPGPVAAEPRVTSVPDDFPIGSGMTAAPQVRGGGSVDGAVDEVPLCGDLSWAEQIRRQATDGLLATDGTGRRGEQRLLLLFADDATAERALRSVRRAAARCATFPGADAVVAVRVGNAVLLNRAPAGRSPGAVTERRELAERSSPLVLRMCVFAEHPCWNPSPGR